MEITVTISTPTEDVTVTIDDDRNYTPEVVGDLCRRAGNEALRLHRENHPAGTDGT